MLREVAQHTVTDEDHLALAAACEPGVGLCTIVGIDGSFSRRIGAQLAVLPDGSTIGSLSDGCLEAQLAADLADAHRAAVRRYGRGSSKIDFRLPCGGGLDIHLDPAPDRNACRQAMERLRTRMTAQLHVGQDFVRQYIPSMHLVVLGEGPEVEALGKLCDAMGAQSTVLDKTELVLGKPAAGLRFDAWTAFVLLFHDHEWELPLIQQALSSDVFYLGAQGGEKARTDRALGLAAIGVPEEQIARVRSPIGLIPSCKSPQALALSALAEIVGEYEQLRARAG